MQPLHHLWLRQISLAEAHDPAEMCCHEACRKQGVPRYRSAVLQAHPGRVVVGQEELIIEPLGKVINIPRKG